MLILLALIFLFYLWYCVCHFIVCHNIREGTLKEYSGAYTTKVIRTRGAMRFVYLENGDVLQVYSELFEAPCDLGQFSSLHFVYSEPKFGIKLAYPCVGISDLNGEQWYLNLESSLKEAKQKAYGGMGFTAVSLLLLGGYIYLLVPKDSHNRFRPSKKSSSPIKPRK